MRAPEGTAGIWCEPWTAGEIYAVAANWAEASAPVLCWGGDGWVHTGRQVADYCHDEREALLDQVREAIAASRGAPDDAIAAIEDYETCEQA